ncbi:MAG: hypothetical protein AMXMBFR84_13150 [Candidatus Hydrogenedentota bacterium]
MSLFLLTIGLCAASHLSGDQTEHVESMTHFPHPLGQSQIYRNVYKSAVGPGNHVATISWIRAITVIKHIQIPEGTMVIRRVTNSNIQYDVPEDATETSLQWFRENLANDRTDHLLFAGDYVYEVDDRVWNHSANQLMPDFARSLAQGGVTPCLHFPLKLRDKWSERTREEADSELTARFEAGQGPAPNPGLWYWIVQAVEPIETPFGQIENTYQLRYQTLGGYEARWFKQGVGFVRFENKHGGSYFESSSELIAVKPNTTD